jgi:hypothetical protein
VVQDTELYRHLLGIEKPWTVARVELSVKEQRVDVVVEHRAGEEFGCPECGKKFGVYDHAEEQEWRDAHDVSGIHSCLLQLVQQILPVSRVGCGRARGGRDRHTRHPREPSRGSANAAARAMNYR